MRQKYMPAATEAPDSKSKTIVRYLDFLPIEISSMAICLSSVNLGLAKCFKRYSF